MSFRVKRAVSWAAVLALCLCFLGPVRVVPVSPPQPESARTSVPATPASCPSPEPPAVSQPEEESSWPEHQPEEQEPIDYTTRFPPAEDEREPVVQRLENFLLDAQIGTFVADINTSSHGEFSSIEELDKGVLLACAIMSAEFDEHGHQDWSRDAVEERARFYFGEGAVVDHFTENPLLYGWEYDEKVGEHIPPGCDYLSYSCPLLLSYAQEEDHYEVVFTSYCVCSAGIMPPDNDGVIFDTWEEAESWYREHGARARAVLRELEDGRLIMESLEILRGYDPWEETQAG